MRQSRIDDEGHETVADGHRADRCGRQSSSRVGASHLKPREDVLCYRENYLELTDRIAPPITPKDADEKTVQLEDLRGKIVILNFVFATRTEVGPLHSDLIAGSEALWRQIDRNAAVAARGSQERSVP